MKEIPKLQGFQKIEITWIDANSQEGWIRPEQYEEWKKEKLVVHTLGYYLDHDDTFLRVCFGRASWDGVPRAVVNTFAVPIQNISSITILNEDSTG